MPQNPIGVTAAVENGAQRPMALDKSGNLVTGKGATPIYAITTSTVVSLGPTRVAAALAQVAGTAVGTIYDATTTAGLLATQAISQIATTQLTPLVVDWPCLNGVVVVPGSGQTLAVTIK